MEKWTRSPKVTDATYDEARSLLEHFGFSAPSKTKETNFFKHPLLADHPKFNGRITVTRPHGDRSTLYSGTVRDIVEAVHWVLAAEKELEEAEKRRKEEAKRSKG